ncbi:phage tail sheath family protein [Rhodohalobacter sp.]|uniref:phage tail sheath family protein n=1 Tax=Rhodohalobacter sp. TaxID=1974210 RepID=UPI002ACE8444|nr:phage tail sheath C-terminal domain-containing protein [Rhodohalobacter sp.]MDZ7758102.1 phage tail sheath subtilisin-like domain-containing protein [Rhodohalobacter sp.]
MSKYRTPGVYIGESSSFPPSVKQVETAIPAFIGYTEKGPSEPMRIRSMVEYQNLFGGAAGEIGRFKINHDGSIDSPVIPDTPKYRLYYSLQLFFNNGGIDCYIISAGNYDDPIQNSDLEKGLKLLGKLDEPTLILLPDGYENPYDLYTQALAQCAARKDRFLICDVKHAAGANNPIQKSAEEFRFGIGSNNLMFGAAYYPNLKTIMTYQYSQDQIDVEVEDAPHVKVLRHSDETISANGEKKEESLYHASDGTYMMKYNQIKKEIDSVKLTLPPSGAIAGVYAMVDHSRGVWKAPANVSLNGVVAPQVVISNVDQNDLNVTASGKSINAIRSFPGRGVMVWGARTLAGNDNEWRYIPARRFFNMVEESVKKATERFVTEPNDANTWTKIKAMIENYLNTLWRAGALAGAKPDDAYFVKLGLGETMSAQDIQQGKMIIVIGMSVLKPAEFTILRYSHKMAEA